MPPVQPQPILAPLTPAAIFLVVTIDDGGEAAVHDALPDIPGLVRAIGFREPQKRLSAIASIGSDAWDRLFAGPRPAELHRFPELNGPRHTAPATPGDLLFHIRAESLDVCFELADRILKSIKQGSKGVFVVLHPNDRMQYMLLNTNRAGAIALLAKVMQRTAEALEADLD